MKDIYIQDFDSNKSIRFINSQEQQALNWVKLGNKQIFSTFGVDYYKYIQSQETFYSVSKGALASYIQSSLASNFINCTVTPQNTGKDTEIFKIEVINNGI
jgi:hypothetical protein